MSTNRKISSRIYTGIIIGIISIFTCYSAANYFYTRNTLISLSTNLVNKTFRSSYNQLEAQILPILTSAKNTAAYLTNPCISKKELLERIEKEFSNYPELYSMGIEFDHAALNSHLSFFKINQDSIIYSTNDSLSIQIEKPDAGNYEIAINSDTITLFYLDTIRQQNIEVWYSFPLNLFTNTLNKETRQLDSKHFLFKKNKQNIVSPTTLDNDSLRMQHEEDLRKIRPFLKAEKFGLFTYPEFYKNEALYLSKIRGTDLILASIMRTDLVIREFRKFFNVAFFLAITAVLILAYILKQIISKVTNPLSQLSAISRMMEKGQLHTEIPEDFKDAESEQLSKTLRKIQGRMQRYVSSLNSTLKAKRELEHDLSLAEKIQLGMLPAPDRALSEFPQIDVYCVIQPAKGVAGDFYDYFFINKELLFFVLGDVSGKGIPAALFMVKTLTLIQIEAHKGKSPGEIFASVNNQLMFRNEEGMFVTAICGSINIKTGDCHICDAGHNTPLSAFKSTDFKYWELEKNMPLGIVEGHKYKETHVELHPEDSLILYSDGLPEANSSKEEMLEYQAIEEILQDQGHKNIQIIANNIIDLYERHTTNALQNDDVTVFIIRFFGEKVRSN